MGNGHGIIWQLISESIGVQDTCCSTAQTVQVEASTTKSMWLDFAHCPQLFAVPPFTPEIDFIKFELLDIYASIANP